jgi:hypothetical protein
MEKMFPTNTEYLIHNHSSYGPDLLLEEEMTSAFMIDATSTVHRLTSLKLTTLLTKDTKKAIQLPVVYRGHQR